MLNYIQKVMATGTQEPENFWEHTSDNSVIRTFLERTDFDVTEKFETLLNGGTISEAIEENLTYNVLTSSEQNLWSLLYLTGYLTKVGSTHNLSETLLKIPNHEVMSIFQKSVTEWFSDSLARSNRSSLFEAGMKMRTNLQKFYPICFLIRSVIMTTRKAFIMHLLPDYLPTPGILLSLTMRTDWDDQIW